MFLNKNDVGLLHQCGFLKTDGNRPCLENKNISLEQKEEYLVYSKLQKIYYFERF